MIMENDETGFQAAVEGYSNRVRTAVVRMKTTRGYSLLNKAAECSVLVALKILLQHGAGKVFDGSFTEHNGMNDTIVWLENSAGEDCEEGLILLLANGAPLEGARCRDSSSSSARKPSNTRGRVLTYLLDDNSELCTKLAVLLDPLEFQQKNWLETVSDWGYNVHHIAQYESASAAVDDQTLPNWQRSIISTITSIDQDGWLMYALLIIFRKSAYGGGGVSADLRQRLIDDWCAAHSHTDGTHM
jgi:hypothetical protein